MRIFVITSVLYISFVEPLFVVAKIIGSPGKNDFLLFSFKNCFKCDYDHNKISSGIMTITLLLRLATHEQLCDVKMCCVCKFDI